MCEENEIAFAAFEIYFLCEKTVHLIHQRKRLLRNQSHLLQRCTRSKHKNPSGIETERLFFLGCQKMLGNDDSSKFSFRITFYYFSAFQFKPCGKIRDLPLIDHQFSSCDRPPNHHLSFAQKFPKSRIHCDGVMLIC